MKIMSNDVPIEHRVLVLAGCMEAACNLDAWAFFADQRVCFSEHETEFLTLFQINGCLDYMKAETTPKMVPCILSDQLGLMWLAEATSNEVAEMGNVMIVLGPFFCSTLSPRAFETTLRSMNLSYQLTKKFMDIFNEIPVLNELTMRRFAKMLHNCIAVENIPDKDIHYQERNPRKREEELLDQDTSILSERSRTNEAVIMQAIREGNVTVDELFQRIQGSAMPVRYESGIPLRDEKDIVIILTALCARAAMEGGLSARLAQHLEAAYVHKVEQARSVSELAHVNREMLSDFLEAVHRAHQRQGLSAMTQDIMMFVQENLTAPFNLTDIARTVGYTEYYMTRKFKKETGESLTDYIRAARLERAKILLRTTSQTIQSISDQLQFGTRNYFTKAFREATGTTPDQYRQGKKGG